MPPTGPTTCKPASRCLQTPFKVCSSFPQRSSVFDQTGKDRTPVAGGRSAPPTTRSSSSLIIVSDQAPSYGHPVRGNADSPSEEAVGVAAATTASTAAATAAATAAHGCHERRRSQRRPHARGPRRGARARLVSGRGPVLIVSKGPHTETSRHGLGILGLAVDFQRGTRNPLFALAD